MLRNLQTQPYLQIPSTLIRYENEALKNTLQFQQEEFENAGLLFPVNGNILKRSFPKG